MKKRVTFTVDKDVVEGLKKVPRGVSVSKMVSWILRGMIEDLTPGGKSPDEFARFMYNDPDGREVIEFMKEKWGPILYPVFDKVDAVTDSLKEKIKPKKRARNVGSVVR